MGMCVCVGGRVLHSATSEPLSAHMLPVGSGALEGKVRGGASYVGQD